MKNIGLIHGTVKILPHQNEWHSNFEREKEHILSLKNKHIMNIEHVGSTSIPNMPAKPIIDLIVGIDNYYNYKKLINYLSKIGYKFKYEPRRYQCSFVKKSGEKETHYLSIIRYKGKYWNKYMNFKNTLINNKKAFEKYKNLKLDQGKKYPDNRKEYAKSKNSLIKELLEY